MLKLNKYVANTNIIKINVELINIHFARNQTKINCRLSFHFHQHTHTEFYLIWIAIELIINWCVAINYYIVQLDFSAAFDRVSHRGLLVKLESLGVGESVLSISREFLSDSWQSVLVEDATSECIPIVSALTGKCVGSSSVHPLYQWNVWAGGEQGADAQKHP